MVVKHHAAMQGESPHPNPTFLVHGIHHCTRALQLITHFATTSMGTPNTPELSIDGLRLIEDMLVKYSRMSVMEPWGYSFTSSL